MAQRSAPNIDSDYTGTSFEEFLQDNDLGTIPESWVGLYSAFQLSAVQLNPSPNLSPLERRGFERKEKSKFCILFK